MPEIDINDLASLGVINDVKPYMLPPEAWTLALNMRYMNGAPEGLLGWSSVFPGPIVAPHFLLPISTASADFWIYAGLTKIGIYDGTTHSDITRAVGGDYSASDTSDLNGTVFGGIPIINNGIDIPQSRANMSPGTKFANLTNWPSVLRAKVIRAFGPYLMAFNLTDTGVSFPHTVQWSHPADPGSIPSSWDYTDPTKDAGRRDFEDVNSGVLLDALPLQSAMYIYKENSTWRTTFIGGRFIFDFKTLFETSGILAPRCVALTGDGTRHCVVTQDDMIWHNGNRVVSILDQRQRKSLFDELDDLNSGTSFLFSNPLKREMWFCYPTTGQTQPNKALIWNYGEGGEKGSISFADGITFRHVASGTVELEDLETWDDGVDTWDEGTAPWSQFTRRRTIAAGTDASKLYLLDDGLTRDGTTFTQMLQRKGLAVLGRKRNGEWIVDHENRKLLQRLWPKVVGSSVTVRFGSQELVDGPVTWGAGLAFNPITQRATDNDPLSGAALALEFSNVSTAWRLDGYKAMIEQLGKF